jgi:predicted anti-sigma-YlaC factor YlaD
MSSLGGIEGFLEPDRSDVGCSETLRVLDVYVDLLAAGADAPRRLPGIAAHLRDCHACHEDLRGLFATASRIGKIDSQTATSAALTKERQKRGTPRQ